MLLLIPVCIAIGLIPAEIASDKGRDFIAWWIYGALFFPIALIHALAMRTDTVGLEWKQFSQGLLKKCPHCTEFIKKDARACRHCGRDVPTDQVAGLKADLVAAPHKREVVPSIRRTEARARPTDTLLRAGSLPNETRQLPIPYVLLLVVAFSFASFVAGYVTEYKVEHGSQNQP